MIYRSSDTDASGVDNLLSRGSIALIGFGSQGEAHARNLNDSGYDVRVGLRPKSSSWRRAEEAGVHALPISEAVAGADVVAMLVPTRFRHRFTATALTDSSCPAPCCCSRTASTSTMGSLTRVRRSTLHSSHPRHRATSCEGPLLAGRARRPWLRCTQIHLGRRSPARWPTHAASAALGRACFRRRSRRKQRPICSESKPCSAAESPAWCRRATKRSSKRGTSPRSLTSNVSPS